jgi:hypothetical protein
MSPGKHKYPPISFRPPEGDRLWLLEYARRTGRPVNWLLAEMLAAERRRIERQQRRAAPLSP